MLSPFPGEAGGGATPLVRDSLLLRRKWDGQPVDEKPLFYQGVEEFTEVVLLQLTKVVQE